MGQPLSHGYPDWGRQQAPSDVTIIPRQTIVLTADTQIFAGFVGLAPYLQLNFEGSGANRARLQLKWYADAALTQLLYTEFIHTSATGNFRGSIPIASPFLEVRADASAFNKTITIHMIIGVAGRVRFEENAFSPLLIHNIGAAIGAGATVNTDTGVTVLGLCHWSVDTALATWTARLQCTNINGTVFTLASIRNTSLPGPRLSYLPAMPARISVTNTTGAAGNFDASLVVHTLGLS